MSEIQPIVFSAPFGNYLGGAGITSTLGTFTREFRAGFAKRVWRIVKTVRYSPLFDAWVNKLGLPNPGIDAALAPAAQSRLQGRLLSIHGFNTSDWLALIDRVASGVTGAATGSGPLGLELNVSCPNVKDDPLDYAAVFARAVQTPWPVVVKLPPVAWRGIASAALDAGVRVLHCCNTLPVARGGMSGKPLQSITLRVIDEVRSTWPDAGLRIIGGGGVTGRADVQRYRDAGASHVAIGSALFFPWMAGRFRRIARELAVQ
ncbi:MAG: hypothetical protein AB7K09_25895 [Planctomycetota bacterium]